MMERTSKRIPLAALATALLLTSGCKSTQPPASTESADSKAPAQQIGGEDVVVLKRAATSNGTKPEFLTATILPGHGMDFLQITANIPGKGVTEILVAPTVSEAASRINADPANPKSNPPAFGGAFLVPYPNRIRGKVSADGKTITTSWDGKPITLPANWAGTNPGAEKHAIHGLITTSKAQDVTVVDSGDGQTLTASIHAGNFGGYWPSQTNIDFTIALHGDAVDATIVAHNIGETPEPMAIGWHPYFAIPSGDRTQARLEIPATELAEVNNYDDVFPTGKLKPVKGTIYDYTSPDGAPLADHFLDDNFSHLTRTDGKVEVKITDPRSNYGIDIEGLSPEIKTVQVYAPPTKQFVAVEEQYNFGDPFGKEWHGMDTGMVTLKPGQSTEWHVRLQLFTPKP